MTRSALDAARRRADSGAQGRRLKGDVGLVTLCEHVPVKRGLEIYGRQTSACEDCGGERVIYTGEVRGQESTLAVFWAFLYDHLGDREVFIDATFGTWGEAESSDDHVTFGSRTGQVEQHPHIASSLVTGAESADDDPRYGQKLTREQALVHPRVDEFWMLNDMVLTEVAEVREFMALVPARRRWPWSR